MNLEFDMDNTLNEPCGIRMELESNANHGVLNENELNVNVNELNVIESELNVNQGVLNDDELNMLQNVLHQRSIVGVLAASSMEIDGGYDSESDYDLEHLYITSRTGFHQGCAGSSDFYPLALCYLICSDYKG